MKYGAVVFDLDGTLTDSQEGITRSVAYALERMGKTALSQDVLRKFLGPPLTQSFAKHAGMTPEETIQATHLYRERYAITGWRENRVYPGVRRLLQALREQGCYLAVATGKLKKASQDILAYFDLARYFDRIEGPEPDEYEITKKELIARALQGRTDAVMIGDRDSDLLGAQAYGIDAIAALYGYGSFEELSQACPKALASSVSDLYALLGIAPVAPRPFFLSLEGNDGVGKTTQTRMLHERLTDSGYSVCLTREPGGSPIAEKIRHILLSTENMDMAPRAEALLYAAARAQHVQDIIEPALNAGQIVLCDRYVDSSIAYQGAGRNLGEDQVGSVNAFAISGVMPDLTILLTMDPLAALERRVQATGSDRIELMDNAFHQRVEQSFLRMPDNHKDRMVAVNATGTPEQVAERVFQVVQDRLAAAHIA